MLIVHYHPCCLIVIKVLESPPSRVNDGEKHEVQERQREGERVGRVVFPVVSSRLKYS